MCEISYTEITTEIGSIFISFLNIGKLSFTTRISFYEPDSINIPENINYNALTPENHIDKTLIISAVSDSIAGNIIDFNPLKLLKIFKYTPFQYEVYKQLAKINRGNTVSYQQLAALSGNIKASRAVGNIMRNNRFLILIPCHRIIRSNGSAGGFGGNTELKLKLLSLEGSFVKCQIDNYQY